RITSALEKLTICDCPNLKSIPYPHETHTDDDQLLLGLSSLREMTIEDCDGLTNLPSEMIESCAQSLESLALLVILNCPMLGVKRGDGSEWPKISHIPQLHVPVP
ncbi:hypothetical protein MIMGU_mgv11b021324mg, partial [Erythranthe guttata]